ncbi:hypothetical protein SDC9_158615 [bioreactor metagenome]|uniref:Uncharacterized protein n=1 Tax=bioreactor metagenome TaxID=1076179 RepID=A0A645FFP0_9ZZZZ
MVHRVNEVSPVIDALLAELPLVVSGGSSHQVKDLQNGGSLGALVGPVNPHNVVSDDAGLPVGRSCQGNGCRSAGHGVKRLHGVAGCPDMIR